MNTGADAPAGRSPLLNVPGRERNKGYMYQLVPGPPRGEPLEPGKPFTGWTDVDLSPQGIGESHRAARLLREAGFSFNRSFTSVLRRAIRTLWIILDDLDLMYIPVRRAWELNERHYGALQGLFKRDATEQYGEAQVRAWRRGYTVRPGT